MASGYKGDLCYNTPLNAAGDCQNVVKSMQNSKDVQLLLKKGAWIIQALLPKVGSPLSVHLLLLVILLKPVVALQCVVLN